MPSFLPPVPTTTVADLPPDGRLVDVREDDEWAAGHAAGAVHIPLRDLPARVRELDDLPGDSPLAVVCRTGGRSGQAVAWLATQGIEAVNVDGGMQAWQAAGRPLVGSDGAAPRVL